MLIFTENLYYHDEGKNANYAGRLFEGKPKGFPGRGN